MTEKEKMLRGEPYNSRAPELLKRYHTAKRLMQKYNILSAQQPEERASVLQALLGFAGEGVWIEAPFYCDYGEQIFIGASTFIHTNCVFLDSNEIHIGKNVLIGPHVQIYTASHPLSAAARIVRDGARAEHQAAYLTTSQPVKIGDNVWIGGNSVIMPGVVVGNDATIGAGSVVTRDIPGGVLAFGNPCRVAREI